MQIVFQGVRGIDYRGDIAIDDVSFTQITSVNACPMNASTKNPWPFDCNFENNLCKWTQIRGNDRFDWTRSRGSTSSIGTGPRVDHTGGTCKLF